MKVTKTAKKPGRRSSRVTTKDSSSSNESASTGESDPAVVAATDQEAIARGGVATPFPWKLHEMLEDCAKEGNEWIVSWQPHGRSFTVHKPKIFVDRIMPTYFNQSKFASFQRQLNLYGFSRLTSGRDKGAYYHNCFVRGHVGLCRGMVRQKIKGTKVRRTLAPEEEPDFYEIVKMEVNTAEPETPTSTTAVVPKQPMPRRVSAPPVMTETPQIRSNRKTDLITAKERAHRLRQQRLNAVRDALKQTEMICDEDKDEVSNRPTTYDPIVPSVSPLESEASDSEESSITAERLHKIPPMPPLVSTIKSEPLKPRKLEPLVPRFHEMTKAQIKGGDLLFFEGKPFHYLEHLDSLPPLKSKEQPQQQPHQQPLQPLQQPQLAPLVFPGQPSKVSPAFHRHSFSTPRDSLQSLMRVDPHALMGAAFGIRQIP